MAQRRDAGMLRGCEEGSREAATRLKAECSSSNSRDNKGTKLESIHILEQLAPHSFSFISFHSQTILQRFTATVPIFQMKKKLR